MLREDQNNEEGTIDANDALAAFPLHVQKFVKLSEQCEKMMQSKNMVEMTVAENRMKLLFASLTADKQQDIRTFLEQQRAGQNIRRQQVVSGTAEWMIAMPGAVIGSLAKTVPAVALSTVEFALATIGAVGVGMYRGGRSIYRQARAA
jgi:hypothetical protein